MKPIRSKLIPILLTCISASLARADFNPVPLTPNSYTFDIVVEKGAPPALPYCITATQGGGLTLGDSTWFEQGFWRSPNTNFGVPHPGQVFTHQSNPNIQYIMPPTYLTNNCLLADSTATGGTLTFATPATCSGLSIFGSSGGGNGAINYTVTHADTTTETGGIVYNDWFNGANPAWIALGRVGPAGGLQNNGNNPRLYSSEITVSTNSPVVSIGFTYASGGTPGIYAVSATTDGTTYTPVVVTGFNEKVIVPAAFPLTATMDQGTNTAANGNLATWFEAGYVTNNTNYGIPPSGSIFSSQSQPTHHYQMGDYSTNNAILIDANHLSANVTPASPAAYTAFALLTAGGDIGGGNTMTNLCILQHQDGVNETNIFVGYDWFEGSVPGFVAYTANGRVNMNDRSVNTLGGGNPKLFESYFVLTDSTSPVTNIVLQYKTAPFGNATTYVMAVSATAGGISPVLLGEPVWRNAYPGNTVKFAATLAAGTAPSFIWQKGPSPTGPFVGLTDGGHVSGSTTTNLTIANVGPGDAGYYQILATNSAGTATSIPVGLYLLTSTLANVTLPGDSISDASFSDVIPPNPGEGVTNVIDRTTAKYLCYGLDSTNAGGAPFQGPVGFILTPGQGNSVVSALRIYTANDHPERDPVDVMLEGSNDGGGSWTTILADTALSLPDARNNTGLPLDLTNQPLQEVDFSNTNGYTSYRVTFNNVKTNATAIGFQVSEIEFLGVVSGPPVVITPFSLPENNVAVLGTTYSLPVGVGGTAPFTFQWSFNGTNLTDGGRFTGSHSNVLIIADVQSGDAGYYQLNITNSQGFYSTYPGGGADQNLIVVAVPTLLTNGLGWSTSANPAAPGPIIQNNLLELTDSAGGTARAAFFDTPMYIGAFKASFLYQDVIGGADGVTLCLQNDPRGTAALGGGGGELGVSGITPSVEFTFNIYSGAVGGVGMSFATNGANGSPYFSTTPVNLGSTDPIAVTIVYNSGVARVTLTDTNNANTFTTNILTGSIPTLVGGQTAFVGFTGADGGVTSTQTITDFDFAPLPALSVATSGSNLVLTWPQNPGGYSLQSETGLTPPNWQNVAAPVTQVGGVNQVTVPITPGPQYYRLTLTLPGQ